MKLPYVVDCKGVNHALFLYGVARVSQKDVCAVHLSKKGESTSYKTTLYLCFFSSYTKYLSSTYHCAFWCSFYDSLHPSPPVQLYNIKTEGEICRFVTVAEYIFYSLTGHFRMSSKQMLFWSSSNHLSNMTHLANSFINNQLLPFSSFSVRCHLKTLEHLVFINIELHNVLAMQLDRRVKSETGGAPANVQTRKSLSERMKPFIIMFGCSNISGNCDLWLVSTVNECGVVVVFNCLVRSRV